MRPGPHGSSHAGAEGGDDVAKKKGGKKKKMGM